MFAQPFKHLSEPYYDQEPALVYDLSVIAQLQMCIPIISYIEFHLLVSYKEFKIGEVGNYRKLL